MEPNKYTFVTFNAQIVLRVLNGTDPDEAFETWRKQTPDFESPHMWDVTLRSRLRPSAYPDR